MKKLPILFGLALLTSVAHAQSAKTAADARRLFDEMRAKYPTFKTYSHTLALQKINDESITPGAKFSFRYPNRFALTVKNAQQEATRVSNGRTLYSYNAADGKKKYHAMPMPPETLGRVGLMQYGAAGHFLTPILAGVDPFAAPWGEAAKSFAIGKSVTVSGVPTDTIIVRLAGDGNEVTTYFIGQKDRLLHGVKHTGGKGQNVFTYFETYKDIRVNPKIPIDTFAFTPPPNTQQEDWMKPYFEGDIPDNLKIGAVPPPIEAIGLQGQPIRLDDYKGRVVLVDFWATWCGPCIAEAPHIKAAYDKFHNQGFEIIGISFDQDRKALEKYIYEKNMPWAQLFDGKMFDGEIGQNYKIHGIPSSFLIGRDGKIAAFNPQKLLLESAIEKALNAPAPE